MKARGLLGLAAASRATHTTGVLPTGNSAFAPPAYVSEVLGLKLPSQVITGAGTLPMSVVVRVGKSTHA